MPTDHLTSLHSLTKYAHRRRRSLWKWTEYDPEAENEDGRRREIAFSLSCAREGYQSRVPEPAVAASEDEWKTDSEF